MTTSNKAPKRGKVKWVTNHGVFLVVFVLLSLLEASHSRPYFRFNQQIPMEAVYEQIYYTSCKISEETLGTIGYFGGYLVFEIPPTLKKICIEIEENGQVERKMKESNMEISLEDPLRSAQYIWTISRMKFHIFITEPESYLIWLSVLHDLGLIDDSELEKYDFLPEYRPMISSRPVIPGKQMPLRRYPNMEDLLVIMTVTSQVYKLGKFTADFTGGRLLLFSKEIKKSTTPLIYSNIEHYLPILTKLYPPSFEYQNLFSSVSFVYRMVYYCTGNIIFPNEAWEMWGLINSFGGGGYIPQYNKSYERAILTQEAEDAFPQERNFFVVLERLIELQDPSWGVVFPPMYGHRKNKKGGLEYHELLKFMESKGIPVPNKNSKDTDGVMGVYLIFHYILNVFIPITTARDLWIVTKAWLSYPTDYVISDHVSFVQYGRHITNRRLKDLDSEKTNHVPRWASGNRSIGLYSEILDTFISEFEHDFPYMVTCPGGELVLKDRSDSQYKYISQNAQKIDRIAIKIAKEIHILFPSIKFSKICELAASFSLIVPFNFQLFSKFKTTKGRKSESGKTKFGKESWRFEDNLEGVEYCRKGILNLLKSGNISLDQYDEYYSIRIVRHLDSACLRIIKTQVKCEIKTPYYLPYQVSNTINTFAGNLANALSSSFAGETSHHLQVAGTIWDGRLQSFVQEERTPSLFRLHNPAFNPESFCVISEKFVIPAVVGYFAKKNLARKKKIERDRKWKQFVRRIKERYYGRSKQCDNDLSFFFEDLALFKEILKSYRIPKGANINDWKQFVLDEESISSFILSQLRKPSDFNFVCRTHLERELVSGTIQFYPISSESNRYRNFLQSRMEKTDLFFKRLAKSGRPNTSLRDMSKLLIFKDESLLEFPEAIASNIRDRVEYERFDLEFKNLVQWYVKESCEKASALLYKSAKSRRKKSCCYSGCFGFLGGWSKDQGCSASEELGQNLSLVEEALEHGLKVIMNNPNINLFVTSTFHNQLNVLKEFGILINTDVLDKNFIINNANFLYMYLSWMNVPITRNMALLSSEIASKLLSNYFIQGELSLQDRIVTLTSDNVDVNNVGNPSFLKVPLQPRSISSFRIYCKRSEHNEMAVTLLETTISTGGFKDSFNRTFLHWRNGYMDPQIACEIVQNMVNSGVTDLEGEYYRVKQSKLCLDFISSSYPAMPQIPIPVCTSQQLVVECGTGNYLDDVFASIIAVNNYKHGIVDYFNLHRDYICFLSKVLSTVYHTPNFTERCKNLFNEIFGFTIYAKKKFRNLNSRQVDSLLDDICQDVNLMHTCHGFSSNPEVTSEIKRVSDIIISEITNEFTDFDFYWRKDVMCEEASRIIRFEFDDCTSRVKQILEGIDFEFPESFHMIICSKINIWPRTCPAEKFSNHSVFSNMFYRYVVAPIFKDDLLRTQKGVSEISFRGVCDALERSYSAQEQGSGDSARSELGIDPGKLCRGYLEELFPSKELYEEDVGLRILEVKKECEPAVSESFVAVAKDRGNFSFFDGSSDLNFENTPYLPDYMQSGGLADNLINRYKLPPRVTLLTIGFFHALNELNSSSKVKYEFSTLGLLYNSVKMVRHIGKFDDEKFVSECMSVSRERIFPTVGDAELKVVCRNVTLSFGNRELVENIYLLYSLNPKVASYYSTRFTSENVSFVSRSHISRVLRGKPSSSLQKVYEQVLAEYVDYIFLGLDSHLPDPKGVGTSVYKRIGRGVADASSKKGFGSSKPPGKEAGEKQEAVQDALSEFMSGSVYNADVKEKHKDKLERALVMYSFLLETKRLGVFRVHGAGGSCQPFEISREVSPKEIMRFMPPDLANWLVSYDNYKFVDKLYVVPVYSDGDKLTGPVADLDFENELLYKELSRKGIALNRVMNVLEHRQKMVSGDKKTEISEAILEATIRFILGQFRRESPPEFASSIVNNSYLFRHMAKRLTLNKEKLFGLRHNITPTRLFINTNYVAFEAIRHFVENHPSEIRSRTDFILNKFDFAKSLHQDSSFYYDGDINSEELKHARNRFFCQTFNEQILRGVDYFGSNPFFECYYLTSKDGRYKRESRHTEGKTMRNCEFSGRLTRAKDIEEKYMLLKSYLKFLLNDSESHFPLVSDGLRLFPETILQGIGRIYGYCLLIGEPLNFYFNNFILRYIKTGNPSNESNMSDYLDNRLNKFGDMISLSFETTDSKKFSAAKMDFQSARKRFFKQEPIYYYTNLREFEDASLDPSLKLKSSGLTEVNNFNNLRLLRRNIARFIGYEKFKTEIDFFAKGVYDIVPRRFLRSFFNSNMFHFTQGYINVFVRNETLLKSLISSYFYVEGELLLPHKRNLVKWFHIALNTLTCTDLGYFFGTFTKRFSIFPPAAYVGRIRIIDVPLGEERNPENRIVIDPLLLVVYIPSYKTYIEVEKGVLRVVEMSKRKLTYLA